MVVRWWQAVQRWHTRLGFSGLDVTNRYMFTVAAACICGAARARLTVACASCSWLHHEFGSWMAGSSGGQSFVVEDIFKVSKVFALDGIYAAASLAL